MILAMVAAATFATAAGDAKCEQPVPVDLGGPRPVVSIRLGGGPPVRAIFDTGATTTVINAVEAPALGLTRAGPLLPPFDRHHAKEGYQTDVKNLVIGDIRVGDQSLPVLPPVIADVAAIISPSIFGERLVIVDFGTATLTVCDRDTALLPDRKPLAYSEPPFALPRVPVRIGDVELSAHLDSGSPMALALPLSLAERLPLKAPLTPAGQARTHASTATVFKGRIIGSALVGPLRLDSPEVHFSEVFRSPNVGTKLFTRLRIVMDPAQRRSWTLETESGFAAAAAEPGNR